MRFTVSTEVIKASKSGNRLNVVFEVGGAIFWKRGGRANPVCQVAHIKTQSVDVRLELHEGGVPCQKGNNGKKLAAGQGALFDMLIPFDGRQVLEVVNVMACGFADFRPVKGREGREMKNAPL